jgi:ABC-type hemin transport system ATPase subunit
MGMGATPQSELSFAFKLTDVVQLDSLIPFKSRHGKLLDVPDEIMQALEAIGYK